MRQTSAMERQIEAPVLALRVKEEERRLETEPEWKSGTEDGITLAKYPHMRVVLVALKRGHAMHEHSVKGPMSMYVVNGSVTLVVDHGEVRLGRDGLFTLRKAILHDVRANSDAVLLLTIMAP